MNRLLTFSRKLARRLRRGAEELTAAVFVFEALLERFGDPGLGFVS